ncbi:MAG: SDR family oxidoreductase [Actinobacteria bacterium]|jgi:NAD(P)-dependent dehydrogenase (short-subunit alcohol dehydrogenase family)|nr:SDR family oxidoreductase [Actinomycetota bacterium]NBY83087.1 SDR family oxidoreductase [Actinomycetota bacterium]NCA26003.1 SDR family oxidoreductase [Actinomycetota bacterium]NCU78478.1 SDR family oxidoreductase [Actinomycetota bacterium]NCU96740.1 SDR family oxidoreductase [Actinomycetota bacterium]
MRLKDKVIIITGATSGIGRALTIRAVAEGARVVIHGIDKVDGQKLVDHLGKNVTLCIADLEDASTPKKIVDCALEAFGQIDSVVNNAATIKRSNLLQITPEEFTKTLTINLQSALFLIQAAFPHLKKSGGSVLNIGSINAYTGESSLLAYSISKAGLQTLTRNLANAHGVDGVRFNLINPGWILTDREYADQIKKGLPENWPNKLGPENIPFGKMSTPEQLAAACIYWLGDESKPFTGSIVDLEQFSIIGRNPEK